MRSVTSSNVEGNGGGKGRVEVRAQLSAEQRDDKQMETAISRLSLEPSVTSVRWQTELPGVNGEDEG